MTEEQIKNAFVALDVALHTSGLMGHEDETKCYEVMALDCAFGAVGVARWGPMRRVNRFAAKPVKSGGYAISHVSKVENDKLRRGYTVGRKRSIRGLEAFEYLNVVMGDDIIKKSPIELYDFLSLIVARSNPLSPTVVRTDQTPSDEEIIKKKVKANPLYGSW
ncbi:MAG: hypothetical protein IBX56_19755 [Methylomicrobium sp.]|nr:hypothetical protein [Methylomicrobium sp.]